MQPESHNHSKLGLASTRFSLVTFTVLTIASIYIFICRLQDKDVLGQAILFMIVGGILYGINLLIYISYLLAAHGNLLLKHEQKWATILVVSMPFAIYGMLLILDRIAEALGQ